jgi:hypothetical protein
MPCKNIEPAVFYTAHKNQSFLQMTIDIVYTESRV